MKNLITRFINFQIKLFKKLGWTAEKVPDKYHTYSSLYETRNTLFLFACLNHPNASWKSKKHIDGSKFEDFFIAGINTPDGQYTQHIPMDLWELFDVTEIPFAPAWDGHTSEDVGRLFSLIY
ncbi:TPA: hypothetical protein ACGO1T_001914 [Streptococcus suis]